MSNVAPAYEIVVGPKDNETFTAESFLSYLRLSNEHWWKNATNSRLPEWVFRGQSNSDWSLVPAAARPNVKLFNRYKSEVRSKFDLKGRTEKPEQIEAALMVSFARYLQKNFVELAIELGLFSKKVSYLVVDPGHILDQKSDIGKSSRNHQHEYLPIAQHHGIPTFMLDWTTKPEIAAFFATSEINGVEHTDLAVFALRRRFNGIDITGNSVPFVIINDLPSDNKYLAAQNGLFTLQMPEEGFVNEGIFEPLEKAIAKLDFPDYGILMKKIILPGGERRKLREILWREQISLAHLMPSLDGVAKSVFDRIF